MSQPRIEQAPPEHISKSGIKLNDVAMEAGIQSVVDDKEKQSSRDEIYRNNVWEDKNRII
jgi:hypothetical protein